MIYPIIRPSGIDRSASPIDFVKFWREFYFDSDQPYDDNIGKELTKKRVITLFRWKNGRVLSGKKEETIKNYINSTLSVPDDNANKDTLNYYLSRFSTVVWPVFWLHCNNPSEFPIIDQNAYRSMVYCTTDRICEPPARLQYINDYIHKYIPFFYHFKGVKARDVDKALWAFGNWLKKQNRIKR